MEAAILSALSGNSGSSLCGATGLKLEKASQKVSEKMESITAELGRTIALSRDDEVRQLVKRSKGKKGRDTFLTERELDALSASVDELENARHEFKRAFAAASAIRARGAKRQIVHTAAKVHCRHCPGKKAECGCGEGCARPEKAKCTAKKAKTSD